MRRLALAALFAVVAAGCGGPRSQLNTPASVCYRGVPAARQSAPGYDRLVHVRRTRRARGAVTTSTPIPTVAKRDVVCVVTLRRAKGASRGSAIFAIVTVDATNTKVLGVVYAEHLRERGPTPDAPRASSRHRRPA